MRRGSALLYSQLNISNMNFLSNKNQSRNQQSKFSSKFRPVKKSISLGANVKDIKKTLKEYNIKIPNIKSKFKKHDETPKNNNIIEKKFFKIKKIIKHINYNKIDIYNGFISFRKIVYKKMIINKYSSPYLKLDSFKNEIYIYEYQKPRLYNTYLINYILDKKKCKIYFRYNEIKKCIDENEYLIIYYNPKQSYNIIKYLLGCLYNNDKYTYSSFIDKKSIPEILINHYKTTINNMIYHHCKNKCQDSSFLLNQYISKLNINNYEYNINNKIYKYIFIEEIPNSKIPCIMPNYLGLSGKLKNIMKKFIDEYKFKKIKTKYYKEKIEREKLKLNKNNEINIDIDDNTFIDKDYTELGFNSNKNISKKVEKSFNYKNNNIKFDYSFSLSSSDSMEEFPLFFSKIKNKNYLKNNFFFFPKRKFNNIDKRIKNDSDFLEIQKFLNENFYIKKSNIKNKKLKSINYIGNIDENQIKDNIFLYNNKIINSNNNQLISTNNNNINEKLIINKTYSIKKSQFPSSIKNSINKKEKIESYNNKNTFINNKNNKHTNNLKSLSYNNQKNLNKNNKKKEIEHDFDFKKLIYKLITKKNYTSYNKKYHYRLKIDNNEMISQQKTENNSTKFKKNFEFVKDFNKQNKLLDRKKKLIYNMVIDIESNKKQYYRNRSLNPLSSLIPQNELHEYYELNNNLIQIKQRTNKITKKKISEKYKNIDFFHNVKTSNEILKYGDIYF